MHMCIFTYAPCNKVAKCIFGNLFKKLNQSCISHLFHYRRHFNSCTLILNVGVTPVLLCIKCLKQDWGMIIEE